MPVPPEQRLKFFVYVIESPSAADVYHKRSEADLLEKAIALNNIQCITRCAISKEAFQAAISVDLLEARAQAAGRVPVVHISAHGRTDGIGLSNGEFLTWSALRNLLLPINQALRGWLLVCLSCCHGDTGALMAWPSLTSSDPAFYALVGNTGKPTWSEAAVAYASFYHLLATGHYLSDAVNAMNVASGTSGFILKTAHEARTVFVDAIKNLYPTSLPITTSKPT